MLTIAVDTWTLQSRFRNSGIYFYSRKMLQEFQAIAIGQHKVEKDDIWLAFGKGGEKLRSVGFEGWRVTVSVEKNSNQLANVFRVVNNHYDGFHRRFCCWAHAAAKQRNMFNANSNRSNSRSGWN